MTRPDSAAQRLREAEWQQGDLLPPLSWSLNFDPDRPLNRMAKQAAVEQRRKLGPEYTPHASATAPLPSSQFFALASQTCDIVKDEEQEPTVVVMGAFETGNRQVLSEAEGNSPRFFLLDPTRGLVVDARKIALVEKPLLARMDRLPGAPDEEMRARFARWIGRRFNRPALPDSVVQFVGSPIVSRIRDLRAADDPSVEVLADVMDIRMAQLQGDPPYDVQLLFVTRGDHTTERVRLALARLVVDMRDWLTDNARIMAWDAASMYEVTAGDYLNTVPLYAEHLTYRGATVDGAEPPRYGYEDFT